MNTLLPSGADYRDREKFSAKLSLGNRYDHASERERALTDLYYNFSLLDQWREGDFPLNAAGERHYRSFNALWHPLVTLERWVHPNEDDLRRSAARKASSAVPR